MSNGRHEQLVDFILAGQFARYAEVCQQVGYGLNIAACRSRCKIAPKRFLGSYRRTLNAIDLDHSITLDYWVA